MESVAKILKYPDPALFTRCTEVIAFGDSLKTSLDEMWNAMIANEGMGLSANQIGRFERMFVMAGPLNSKYYIVNPKLVTASHAKANIAEGCLSAPGRYLHVPSRSQNVVLNYQTENGDVRTKIFEGVYAVCVQHEIDHLDGKSFLEIAP